jgi:hypothetical protein
LPALLLNVNGSTVYKVRDQTVWQINEGSFYGYIFGKTVATISQSPKPTCAMLTGSFSPDNSVMIGFLSTSSPMQQGIGKIVKIQTGSGPAKLAFLMQTTSPQFVHWAYMIQASLDDTLPFVGTTVASFLAQCPGEGATLAVA